jgi:hypothetical protein
MFALLVQIAALTVAATANLHLANKHSTAFQQTNNQ